MNVNVPGWARNERNFSSIKAAFVLGCHGRVEC